MRERLGHMRPIDAALAAGFVVFAVAEEFLVRTPGRWWPYLLAAYAGLIVVRRAIPLLVVLPHLAGPWPDVDNVRLWQVVAMMIATYTLGRYVPPTTRIGSVGPVLVLITMLTYWDADTRDPMAAVFFPAAPYVLGVALALQARRNAEATAERAAARERLAREAVTEERVRIARELHDMVAHSVTVMVIQAGAVRRRLAAGLPVDAELLHGIEDAGRDAVGELRRTLGLLRGEGADTAQPPAGLDRLDELVAQVGEAGLPVTVNRAGDPVAVPPAIDLSAFRIVQEALTNALKHGRAGRAEVTIGFRPDGLHLSVTNDGPPVGEPAAGGQGLIGMRERATLFGGELSAGPRQPGGFAVRCRLPLPVVTTR